MKININAEKLKQHRKVLNAFNNKKSLAIINFLAEKEECNVTGIHKSQHLTQPVASIVLKYLRAANVVKTERRGKSIFYSLNKPLIDHFLNFIHST